MLSKEEIEKAKKECKIAIKCIRSDIRCEDTEDNFILAESMEILLQYIYQLEQENNKQNRIIDETIKYIATLDIEEDICSKIENEYCDKMSLGECECCIKQYFEKKVEGN